MFRELKLHALGKLERAVPIALGGRLLLIVFVTPIYGDSPMEEDTFLASPDPKQRAEEEKRIFELGPKGVTLCTELAGSGNLAIRMGAIRILRKLAENGSVSSYVLSKIRKSLIESQDPEVRAAFYAISAKVGGNPTPLLAGLKDSDRGVRIVILKLLVSLKKAFVPRNCLDLLKSSTSGDPLIPMILATLRYSSPPTDPTLIEQLLNSVNLETVAGAARVLGHWKVEASAGRLARVGFFTSSKEVRFTCFRALGAIGEAGKKEILVRTKSSQGHLREQAALALAHFPSAVKTLMRMMEGDPYGRVRMAASIALQRVANLESNQDYFLRYDATEDEQKEVFKRWREFWIKQWQKEDGGRLPFGNPKPFRCPLMNRPSPPAWSVDFDGYRYIFCCKECIDRFHAMPHRMVKAIAIQRKKAHAPKK